MTAQQHSVPLAPKVKGAWQESRPGVWVRTKVIDEAAAVELMNARLHGSSQRRGRFVFKGRKRRQG